MHSDVSGRLLIPVKPPELPQIKPEAPPIISHSCSKSSRRAGTGGQPQPRFWLTLRNISSPILFPDPSIFRLHAYLVLCSLVAVSLTWELSLSFTAVTLHRHVRGKFALSLATASTQLHMLSSTSHRLRSYLHIDRRTLRSRLLPS